MISLDNVTKIYGNKVDALLGVTLEIAEGDIFGIVGKSGAGKSTMLKLMGLLEKPTSGKIKILDSDVSTITAKDANAIKKNIGTVFQGFNLLAQRNVEKNIAFPLELIKEKKPYIKARCAELAEVVDLSEKLKAYPVQLSGGQKQRVAIARALATKPKILLCDEPTSALDSFTTREILKLLKEINKKLGITIVIITHEIGVVKSICNKTVVLDEGTIAEMGNTAEVLKNPQSPITKLLLGIDEDEIL
ncbi:MAG: methionine ABC transporter ATP-binding protein [Defluviitaleaceae bacterium]|nr:methionine ABC transporter ATP-binding protein [Defluviitaleaceae bacterium]